MLEKDLLIMVQRPDDSCFIQADDGWTLPGYLAPVENLHKEVRFTYRPFTIQQRSMFLEAIESKRSHEGDEALARALSKHIRSWELKQPDGEKAPITPEMILLLKYAVFLRFAAIVVYGTQGSDTDPKWDEPEKKAQSDALLEAAINGTRPASELAEQQLKN